LGQVEKIANNLKAVGAGIVLLTGGEPFLRKDLPEVIRIFRAKGLDVRLQTAGKKVATLDMLTKCYAAGARDINVSFDSLDAAKADFINGVEGSWQTAVESLSLISSVFKKSAICSLGCVLSRYNYREIPSILEFATKIGWFLSLVPVHIAPEQDELGFRSHDRSFVFQPEDLPQLEKVMEKLISMKRQGYWLFDSEEYLRSTLNFVRTGEPKWRHQGICDSPNLYFIIRPNGEMAVCCDYALPGEKLSVADKDFPKKFRDPDFRARIRAQVTSVCRGCHYGSYPEVTLSVRSLPVFWERLKLTLSSVRPRLKEYTAGEMLAIIAAIKKQARDVYPEV